MTMALSEQSPEPHTQEWRSISSLMALVILSCSEVERALALANPHDIAPSTHCTKW